MATDKDLRDHAMLVAKDIKAGKATAKTEQAREFMEETPQAVLGVIGLIQQAAGRKKPNQSLVYAYAYMLTCGLEIIRYQTERGQDWAEDLVDNVRCMLELLGTSRAIDPGLMMLLLNCFIEARLEPGDDLTRLLGELTLDHDGDDLPDDLPSDIGVLFDGLVQEVGNNEFQVHDAIAEINRALPPEFRQAMLPQLATAENPVLRDAATLYLLDPSAEVRQSFCQVMIENASPDIVSPAALRRMISLRNWLPERERPRLDAAIKKARQKQVDYASWPTRQVLDIQASNIDGVGAQSIFAIVKDGRKHIIAGLLVKQGVGIQDAWCLRDQTKADVRDFTTEVHARTEAASVDLDFVRLLITHHLAVGLEAGKVPPAGLLDVVEVTGIEMCHPSALTIDELITVLSKDISQEKLGPKAVDEVIQNSSDWLDQFDFMESWFENDALVEEVLDRHPRSKTPGKIKAVIKSVLEPRRVKWAERFLWTSLLMKQQKKAAWQEFFIMGLELHRKRPLAQIPTMHNIAKVTVEAGVNPWF